MDAKKAIISNIIEKTTLLKVPFFQRAYVWDEELWQRFLDDMEYIAQSNKTHFLGSIILKHKKNIFTDKYVDCKAIVDGQQRLTTYTIFLKVLCMKLNMAAYFDGLFKMNPNEFPFQHGKDDFEPFNKIVSIQSAEPITDYPYESKIIDAYNFFIKNVKEEKFPNGMSSIMSIVGNALFVKIDLDADDDAQQIFDTLNSLGVNLTTSELLKNYFFSKESIAEYENIWVPVFEKDNDTKQYWNTEIEAGRVKRALIDIFFDSYFQLYIQNKNYKISNEDKLMYARVEHLAQSYQHFINNYCNGDKSVILKELANYANCFRNNINPDYCNQNVNSSEAIGRINIIIFGLKTTTMIPYVLFIANNVSDKSELSKMYGLIESYIMRRIIVHATTKNYNKLFTSLILNEVKDYESLKDKLKVSGAGDSTMYIPTDDDVKNGIENSKLINAQTKGILYLIESKIRPSNSSTVLLGYNGYSLEHLMPKNWRKNWGMCPNESLANERDSKLLTLGNLAIITQSLNASIRDADWKTKKAGKEEKPGLAMCAAGLSTLYDALTKDFWNEEEINKRAQWLDTQAIKIWSI